MKDLTKKIKLHDFQPAVLGEQVSQILTDAILEGTLKQGEQLLEAELQKQFGISRSPLREAFRDLEKRGLVVIVPRKGTFVKAITEKDIRENFPVRAALEGLAARQASSKMTEKELKELKQALEGMRSAGQNREAAKVYREHHHRFHEIFINASRNDTLINILRTLRMHRMWYYVSYQYYRENHSEGLEVHENISRLFENRNSDEKEIEKVVRDHIESHLDKFLDYLDGRMGL
ncbi:MAG: GntR family transcriptional regulator [Desulfobacteraceae bacterium]|nr:GntR family transcriptional regulator [Desulfobacteraceae bacterium]